MQSRENGLHKGQIINSWPNINLETAYRKASDRSWVSIRSLVSETSRGVKVNFSDRNQGLLSEVRRLRALLNNLHYIIMIYPLIGPRQGGHPPHTWSRVRLLFPVYCGGQEKIVERYTILNHSPCMSVNQSDLTIRQIPTALQICFKNGQGKC